MGFKYAALAEKTPAKYRTLFSGGLSLILHFVFQETMNWKRVAGTFTIIAGVVLINAV